MTGAPPGRLDPSGPEGGAPAGLHPPGQPEVFTAPATCHPTGQWLEQQVRNTRMWAEEQGIGLRFVIRDWDTKYIEVFHAVFAQENGGAVNTPYGGH